MELTTIVIEEEASGKQLMEITPINTLDNTSFEEANIGLDIELSSQLTSALGQLTPSLLTASKTLNSNLMEVSISGDLFRVKDGRGYRALAKGADGKISEHARLFEPKSLKNMVKAAATWQVLSVAVAQSHLAEINDKLEEIKKTVSQISDFQKNTRTTDILAIQDEMGVKISSLKIDKNKSKEKDILTMATLDSWSTKLSQIHKHLLIDIERILKDKGTDYEKIKEKTINVKRLIKEATLSLYLRIVCYELSALIYQFTIEPQRQKIRVEMEKIDELLVRLYKQMYIEIDQLSSWTISLKSLFGFGNKFLTENYEKLILADLLDERKTSCRAPISSRIKPVSELEYQKFLLKKTISDAGTEYNNRLPLIEKHLSSSITNILTLETPRTACFLIDNDTNTVKCVNVI